MSQNCRPRHDPVAEQSGMDPLDGDGRLGNSHVCFGRITAVVPFCFLASSLASFRLGRRCIPVVRDRRWLLRRPAARAGIRRRRRPASQGVSSYRTKLAVRVEAEPSKTMATATRNPDFESLIETWSTATNPGPSTAITNAISAVRDGGQWTPHDVTAPLYWAPWGDVAISTGVQGWPYLIPRWGLSP